MRRHSIALFAAACAICADVAAQHSHPQPEPPPSASHHLHHGDQNSHPAAPAAPPASAPHAGQHLPARARTPVPPLTATAHARVYRGDAGHTTHENAVIAFWLLDQLEWQEADGDDALSWKASGWIGTDMHTVVWRSEGERSDGATESAELELLWEQDLGPWWSLIAGVRHDFKPASAQTWSALGLHGTPLYGLETELTLYWGEGGQSAARLETGYDILLTNRLILQPTAELNLHGRNDPARAIGSGLSDIEVGLRLRYELRREFAPYIGVSWTRHYGSTADFVSAAGERVEETRLVLGVRAWY